MGLRACVPAATEGQHGGSHTHTPNISFCHENTAYKGASFKKPGSACPTSESLCRATEPSKRLTEQEEELEGRYTSHLQILEPVKEEPRTPFPASPKAAMLLSTRKSWKQHRSVSALKIHSSVSREEPPRASGHVAVLVGTVLVSLHVVSVYERFDSLFQISRLEKKNKSPNYSGVKVTTIGEYKIPRSRHGITVMCIYHVSAHPSTKNCL